MARNVFPPRPVNYEDDPDATGLTIIVVPANHFLPAEGLPNIPVVPRTAPVIVGGAIPIDESCAFLRANSCSAMSFKCLRSSVLMNSQNLKWSR